MTSTGNPAAIERTVRDTLAEILEVPAGTLAAEPVLAGHDWDSLRSLDALAQLEDRLGLAFDLRTFHAARTVEDLVELAVTVAGGGEDPR